MVTVEELYAGLPIHLLFGDPGQDQDCRDDLVTWIQHADVMHLPLQYDPDYTEEEEIDEILLLKQCREQVIHFHSRWVSDPDQDDPPINFGENHDQSIWIKLKQLTAQMPNTVDSFHTPRTRFVAMLVNAVADIEPDFRTVLPAIIHLYDWLGYICLGYALFQSLFIPSFPLTDDRSRHRVVARFLAATTLDYISQMLPLLIDVNLARIIPRLPPQIWIVPDNVLDDFDYQVFFLPNVHLLESDRFTTWVENTGQIPNIYLGRLGSANIEEPPDELLQPMFQDEDQMPVISHVMGGGYMDNHIDEVNDFAADPGRSAAIMGWLTIEGFLTPQNMQVNWPNDYPVHYTVEIEHRRLMQVSDVYGIAMTMKDRMTIQPRYGTYTKENVWQILEALIAGNYMHDLPAITADIKDIINPRKLFVIRLAQSIIRYLLKPECRDLTFSSYHKLCQFGRLMSPSLSVGNNWPHPRYKAVFNRTDIGLHLYMPNEIVVDPQGDVTFREILYGNLFERDLENLP